METTPVVVTTIHTVFDSVAHTLVAHALVVALFQATTLDSACSTDNRAGDNRRKR